MKSKISIIILIIYSGLISYLYFSPTPEIIVKETKYNTIKKDVAKMPIPEIKSELQCYYTAPILIDVDHIVKSNYMINVELCDRKASKEFKVKVGSNENWKYYLGGGVIVGAVATGVLVYLVK